MVSLQTNQLRKLASTYTPQIRCQKYWVIYQVSLPPLLKFIIFWESHKIWKHHTLLSNVKKNWEIFFKILCPSQNIWTLSNYVTGFDWKLDSRDTFWPFSKKVIIYLSPDLKIIAWNSRSQSWRHKYFTSPMVHIIFAKMRLLNHFLYQIP